MKKKATIAGLQFELKFCKKVNTEPINSAETCLTPVVNISKSQSLDTFEVNIMLYVPTELWNITDRTQSSFYMLTGEDEKKMLFSYNGVSIEKTSIGEQHVTCRNFSIDYDNRQENPVNFDLYHTKLHYSIIENSGQTVEAIIVHGKNLDPETSRGTITTVRFD